MPIFLSNKKNKICFTLKCIRLQFCLLFVRILGDYRLFPPLDWNVKDLNTSSSTKESTRFSKSPLHHVSASEFFLTFASGYRAGVLLGSTEAQQESRPSFLSRSTQFCPGAQMRESLRFSCSPFGCSRTIWSGMLVMLGKPLMTGQGCSPEDQKAKGV